LLGEFDTWGYAKEEKHPGRSLPKFASVIYDPRTNPPMA
jgi:hypothetical protein